MRASFYIQAATFTSRPLSRRGTGLGCRQSHRSHPRLFRIGLLGCETHVSSSAPLSIIRIRAGSPLSKDRSQTSRGRCRRRDCSLGSARLSQTRRLSNAASLCTNPTACSTSTSKKVSMDDPIKLARDFYLPLPKQLEHFSAGPKLRTPGTALNTLYNQPYLLHCPSNSSPWAQSHDI